MSSFTPTDVAQDLPFQNNWPSGDELVFSQDLRSLSGATLQVEDAQRLDEVGVAVAYPEQAYKSPLKKRQRSNLQNVVWRDPWPLQGQDANSPNSEGPNRSNSTTQNAVPFPPVALKAPCRECHPSEALPFQGVEIPGIPSGPEFAHVRPPNLFNSPQASNSASQRLQQTIRDTFSQLGLSLKRRQARESNAVTNDIEAYKDVRRSSPTSLTFDPVLERQRELEERDAAEGYGQTVAVGKYKYLWFAVIFMFIAMFLCLFLYTFGILK
jgi:hypothetical protein